MATAYIKDTHEIIIARPGTGDNLSDEEIEEGYEDYVYYTTYDSDPDLIEELDGGMILLREPFENKFKDSDSLMNYVIDFHYGVPMEYIMLRKEI